MILTAKDLRALLKHFDLPEEGSQEELLKRLKYFLILTDRLSGFETVKQTPTPFPLTSEMNSLKLHLQDSLIIKDRKLTDHLRRSDEIEKQAPTSSRCVAPSRQHDETNTHQTPSPESPKTKDWRLPFTPNLQIDKTLQHKEER
jgi:hypothetical protein